MRVFGGPWVRRALSSASRAEVEKFEQIASRWWDPSGPFAPLHVMHPERMRIVSAMLAGHGAYPGRVHAADGPPPPHLPLLGLRVADIGCGGGLVSESLARLGADVLGVDAGRDNVAAAAAHARSVGVNDGASAGSDAAEDDPFEVEAPVPARFLAPLDGASAGAGCPIGDIVRPRPTAGGVTYRAVLAEDLVASGASFDAVVSLEVVEHVTDPAAFLADCGALVAPGGAMAVSTINRTRLAMALAVFAAERVLRWVPEGTHEWSKFVTPGEVNSAMARASVNLREVVGMRFDLLTGKWVPTSSDAVNYIAFGVKDGISVSGDNEKP